MFRIKFINKIYILKKYIYIYIRFFKFFNPFYKKMMRKRREFYSRGINLLFPLAYFRIILQTRVESNSAVNSEQSIMEINSPIGRRALPPGNNRPIFPKQNLYTNGLRFGPERKVIN